MCENINHYVKELRKSKGINITNLAREIGVSRTLVSIFENGKGKMSDYKVNELIKVLSANEKEYKSHTKYIQEMFAMTFEHCDDDFGLTTYDLSDIDKLAKTLTYKGKQISPSNIALIKQLAQALADK